MILCSNQKRKKSLFPYKKSNVIGIFDIKHACGGLLQSVTLYDNVGNWAQRKTAQVCNSEMDRPLLQSNVGNTIVSN